MWGLFRLLGPGSCAGWEMCFSFFVGYMLA